MTAYSDLESAVAAFQGGAFEYLPKPFDVDQAVELIRRAVQESAQAAPEEQVLQSSPDMLGQAPSMQEVFRAIGRLSQSSATVLITGESGTGKELVARALHRHSPRASATFVAINTAAMPKDLLESELFGHERGAFTGAVAAKKGLCDLADKGTIFFDEIGNIPLETQAKLLRVIQEREFMRLGGMDTIKVDVRIVAATNCDLKEMVDDGRFREDLYYRLHVINIRLPSLRERKEDIPLLAAHFLEKYGVENNKREMELSADALDLMMDYDWPGNVRELERLIERLVALAERFSAHLNVTRDGQSVPACSIMPPKPLLNIASAKSCCACSALSWSLESARLWASTPFFHDPALR